MLLLCPCNSNHISWELNCCIIKQQCTMHAALIFSHRVLFCNLIIKKCCVTSREITDSPYHFTLGYEVSYDIYMCNKMCRVIWNVVTAFGKVQPVIICNTKIDTQKFLSSNNFISKYSGKHVKEKPMMQKCDRENTWQNIQENTRNKGSNNHWENNTSLRVYLTLHMNKLNNFSI